jgi:hypothetical protein
MPFSAAFLMTQSAWVKYFSYQVAFNRVLTRAQKAMLGSRSRVKGKTPHPRRSGPPASFVGHLLPKGEGWNW